MFGSDFHENCQNELYINDNNEKCAHSKSHLHVIVRYGQGYVCVCLWILFYLRMSAQ